MRIAKITVSNFRGLKQCSVRLNAITALLGDNNSGKSTFLHAIELFFASSPKVQEEDFFQRDTSQPILITLEFVDLTPSEHELFQSNLLDGALTITRSILSEGGKESGAFSVDALVNPDFTDCRNEAGNKKPQREKYDALMEAYPDLPKVTNADQIDANFQAWENDHPEKLVRQRVGGFRGFQNVAAGQLKQKTEFILVPAVKNASDDIGAKSPINQILDSMTRFTIENSEQFKKFQEEIDSRISELTSPANFPTLKNISGGLTEILKSMYAQSELVANWQPVDAVPLALPSADVMVNDQDLLLPVDAVGHGLQRAVILTLLQYVAHHRASENLGDGAFKEAQSDLILGVEEPEIYQHPTKQRLFRKVLRSITDGFSAETGIRVQVVLVTHSPLFIEFPHFDDVRLVRRTLEDGERAVSVREATLDQCSRKLAVCAGQDVTDAFPAPAFASKLHIFTPEVSEGFFGRCVVLVEGVSDKAILEAWYAHLGREPMAEGIVISNVESKTKLDKPAVIFREIGVPVFVLFDNDKTDKPEQRARAVKENRIIQRVMGVAEEDCIDWPDQVTDSYCAWDGNLEKYIRSLVGDDAYLQTRKKHTEFYGVRDKGGEKSPEIAREMLKEFAANEIDFSRLNEVVLAVDRLVSS